MLDMEEVKTKNKIAHKGVLHISRFKEKLKKTKPHKHELYYEVILLLEGEGVHTIEDCRYQVSPPEMFLLKPGDMHHWEFTSIPRGYVLLAIDEAFDPLTELSLLDALKQIIEERHIPSVTKSITTHFEAMRHEQDSADDYSMDIIKGHCRAMFAEILRLTQLVRNEQPLVQNNLYKSFEKLLLGSATKLHRVKDYAELLHTTPQNLNAVCRREQGRSASELINNHLVIEAKRYLLHTNNSIQEISYLLNFSAASNFISLFKRIEGVTPAHFRATTPMG